MFLCTIDDIPEALFRQMTTCQTAANEFLRQFWLTVYPPPADLQLASAVSPAQKAAKAAKMIGYLEKTHEKVGALVGTAKQNGVDPARVQMVSLSRASCSRSPHCSPRLEQAMKPVLDAVDKAITFWRAQNAPRGAR